MAPAALAHQEVLRHQRERGEDANLDRDHQEALKTRSVAVWFATGALAHAVRKSDAASAAARGYATREPPPP